MTLSYKELLEQREALDRQINEAREREQASALAQVRQLVTQFGLTVQQVFPPTRGVRAAGTGAKVAPKYRNPATGETWTGRGKPPRWIQDQDRTQFLI